MFSIKQARLLADKTQEQLADSLNIHVQTYRKIEKDPGSATIRQAQQIAKITGIPLNEIFFGE